jgi:hypothetical protein
VRVAFQDDDASRVVAIEERVTGFVPAMARKLDRLNMSRVRANRFLPDSLKYNQMRVHASVAGDRSGRDRQFVFLDTTKARDLLDACPEVFADPAKRRLMTCFELISNDRHDEALRELEALEVIAADLPDFLRIRIPYNIASIYGLRARKSRGEPRERLLGEGYKWIRTWALLGISGTWEALALSLESQISRMIGDGDVRPVLDAHKEEIRQLFPREYRTAIPAILPKVRTVSGAGRGCSPCGAGIAVAGGVELVQNLRPGDTVITVDPTAGTVELARVEQVRIRTATELVVLNEEKSYTSTQPLFCTSGTVCVGAVQPGMIVYDQQLRPYRIETVRRLNGLFDVYDLSIEHRNHSYVSQGLLCHNKYR